MARRVIVAMCFSLLASIATGAHAQSWTIETLESASTSGNSMTLRLNPEGLKRFTWWTSSTGIIVSGDGWTTQTLPPISPLQDPAGSVAARPADPNATNLLITYSARLALGADDTPWVATVRFDCFGNCTGVAHVYHRTGGTWSIENLGVTDAPAAIEVGADGRVHVSYKAWYTNELLYWVRATDGTWTSEPVGVTSYRADPSLQLDAAGEPHLSWINAGQLWYAARVNGVWQTQFVDSGGIGTARMVLTAAGEPRIAFVSGGPTIPKGLWYAVPSAGGWARTPVVPGLACSGLELALDPAGDPFIAYNDQAGLDLRFASRKQGVWTVDDIDTFGNTGYYPSVAFDHSGRPLVAYQASSIGSRLATGTAIVSVEDARPAAAFAIRALGGIARIGGPLSLELTSPSAQRVSFQLVDVAGRVLARMDERDVPAGVSSLRWDAAPPAPGIYFVRARTSAGESGSARLPVLR